MAVAFRKHVKGTMMRDIRTIQGYLAVGRKRERKLKAFKKQTDALLQMVSQETLERTAIVWSLMGVDAATQTDEQSGPIYTEDGSLFGMGQDDNADDDNGVHGSVLARPVLSPVYQTLEDVLLEMANKGINNVVLSSWLVSLLAIIRRMNPTVSSFSNYYYKNEARAQGTPGSLYMLKAEAGTRFTSALDNMCTYSPAGTGKGLFSDSELLVHYAVANASRLTNTDISYAQFCVDPSAYKTEQLAVAVNFTILDIVEFVRKPLSPNEKPTVSAKWFPPSYVNVIGAVTGLLHARSSSVAKNSVLVQFLPLATSASQQKADLSNKEAVLLGVVMRTALMWYSTYSLSSTVQNDSIRTYRDLLNHCMIRDVIVMQSLYSMGKGPYLSTGTLLPGLFAYLFYISKEAGLTQRVGALCISAHPTWQPSKQLAEGLKSWCAADFNVRDNMASFICGDSVLKSKATTTVAAFPGTTRVRLQAQIDSALVSFMREMLIFENAYTVPNRTAIDYLKEALVTNEYLQVSQRTRITEYNMAKANNMTGTAVTGFLKNPFLYKVHNTMNFDMFGRETVLTNRDTVVSTPVVL
jgi:hypothetical protein